MQNELTKTAEMLDRRRATRAAWVSIITDAPRGARAAYAATFPGLDDTQRGIVVEAGSLLDETRDHFGARDQLFFLINQRIN